MDTEENICNGILSSLLFRYLKTATVSLVCFALLQAQQHTFFSLSSEVIYPELCSLLLLVDCSSVCQEKQVVPRAVSSWSSWLHCCSDTKLLGAQGANHGVNPDFCESKVETQEPHSDQECVNNQPGALGDNLSMRT